MHKRFLNKTFPKLIGPILLIFCSLQIGSPSIGSAFDRQADTNHNARSSQEPNGPDNPNPNKNKDKDKDPVELLTGNFRYQFEDMAIPSGPGRLALERHYNNQDRYNGPLGFGWNFTFNMKIIFVSDENGNESAILRDYSGRRFVFTKATNGSFTPPDGWVMSLVADGQGGYTFKKSCGKIYTFNAAGNLTRIGSCCEAGRLDLTYDTQNRLLSVADTYGGSFTFTYNSSNKIIAVTNVEGDSVRYLYSANEDLIEFQGLNNEKIRYTYDTRHNLSGELNGKGEILLQNSYDTSDRVISQNYSGGLFTFSYDSTGRIITITDADGNRRIHKVNEFGQPLEVTDELGRKEYYVWDTSQHLLSFTNRDGKQVLYQYDANGNRSKMILGDGREINITYNSNNRADTYTDLGGNITNFTYNADGALTKKTYPSGQRYLAKTYNANGQVSGTYNALPGNSALTPMYHLTYDNSGRVNQVTYADNSTDEFYYNAKGRLQKNITRRGQTIFYSYNAAGLVTSVNYKSGNSFQVYGFTYSPEGNLLRYTDPSGESTNFTVDKFGRLTSITDPLGHTTSYTHLKDKITSRTDANGNITSYTYDAAGNLSTITYPDLSSITYTYDNMNRITSANDGTVAVNFSYNLFSSVTQLDVPYLQKTLAFNYDTSGRNSGSTVTDAAAANQVSTFSYTYDADGIITGITAPDSTQTSKQLDAEGRAATILYANGITEERTFNALTGRLARIHFKKGTGTVDDILYTYDLKGNITAVTRNGTSTAYEYDEMTRLTKAIMPDGTVQSYTYDQRDNRITTKNGAQTSQFTYDRANRLIQDGTFTYTYDNNGNIITKSNGQASTTYTYDYENRLTSITMPDSKVISYRYYPTMPKNSGTLFGLGEQLISKAVNGTDTERYLVGLDFDLIMTLAADNTLKSWHSGGLFQDDIYKSSNNSGVFYLRDIISTVVSETDTSGVKSSTYSYDPFGSPTASTPALFGYTGRIHQPDSGLIYYRARFYNPAIGRFMSQDYQRFNAQDARHFNLYAYVLNNPIMFMDPTGHKTKCPGSAWTGLSTGAEAHLVFGVSITTTAVCCTLKPSLCCTFASFAGSVGVEASASSGINAIQFFNCGSADDIAGWGGGVSGEIAVGAGVDVGASISPGGCGAISGGGGAGIGGGVSADFGYTWNKGCTK